VRRHIGISLFVMIRRAAVISITPISNSKSCRKRLRTHASWRRRHCSCLLDQQGRVDVARTLKLVELAAPLPVTFHRAIDMTPDLPTASKT